MLVSVTVQIHLRQHADPDHPVALPPDVSPAAIRDTVSRLLGIHAQGQLVLTTLFRAPGDPDSDAIEDVGGGLTITGVQVWR